ncbi:MAG TPA: C40 family peptidase [Gemmatimonadales bacterium]|nr:C40 family peptidase [Gemmatimonadales bacterium]
MPTTMSRARYRHSSATRRRKRRLAYLLALGPAAGCAQAPIRLDVSPTRGPTIHAAVGPLSVSGGLGRGGLGVDVASAAQVLATADRYVGTPYRYGGESPAEGFDCSGFVQYVFGRQGVELPRTSSLQAGAGRAAPRVVGALQPGDLMFFASKGRRVDHVAIYAGDGRIIHASAGSGRVRYDEIDSDRGNWFLDHLVTSRRVLADARRV